MLDPQAAHALGGGPLRTTSMITECISDATQQFRSDEKPYVVCEHRIQNQVVPFRGFDPRSPVTRRSFDQASLLVALMTSSVDR